jgi:hypothetical protein
MQPSLDKSDGSNRPLSFFALVYFWFLQQLLYLTIV